MEKKYFKLKKEVKFVDIKPRTIIVCMNNKYYTYDKIEEIQREYEHLDNKLTLMEYNFI